MSGPGRGISRLATRCVRRLLVGGAQKWRFERPSPEWRAQRLTHTSLYLHVPFCRNCCPYCPYLKVPYLETLLRPYAEGALAEVDRWSDTLGDAEIGSIYVGGGTPTQALDSVEAVLCRARRRFRVIGDISIETSPPDIDTETVRQLHGMEVTLISLGVQSFRSAQLSAIGRRYDPAVAERALALLAGSGFKTVNADLLFAIPGQTEADLISDLDRAASLGASQITTYPLFTFPYTSVGEYLKLKAVRMPHLRVRKRQYRVICEWCRANRFERVSVWGFRRGNAPRYSSVTRDGYIGIGPGAGSYLPDGFTLNTFDLSAWMEALREGRSPVALRMPFHGRAAGWWWLYWRLYEGCVPLNGLHAVMGDDSRKARALLYVIERAGLARSNSRTLELTDRGAFWLHLAQNHFALSYVNTLWTAARREAWPQEIAL